MPLSRQFFVMRFHTVFCIVFFLVLHLKKKCVGFDGSQIKESQTANNNDSGYIEWVVFSSATGFEREITV